MLYTAKAYQETIVYFTDFLWNSLFLTKSFPLVPLEINCFEKDYHVFYRAGNVGSYITGFLGNCYQYKNRPGSLTACCLVTGFLGNI